MSALTTVPDSLASLILVSLNFPHPMDGSNHSVSEPSIKRYEKTLFGSVKNILRNKFLSISSILVLTLLMFFINILIILHDVSFKLIDSINSKLTISLYLVDDYDKNSIDVIDMIEDISHI